MIASIAITHPITTNNIIAHRKLITALHAFDNLRNTTKYPIRSKITAGTRAAIPSFCVVLSVAATSVEFDIYNMNQYEATVRILSVLFIIAYFPVVLHVPESVSVSILFLTACVAFLDHRKIKDDILLMLQFVVVYHAYTIIIRDVTESIIVSLASVLETGAVFYYLYSRIDGVAYIVGISCCLLKIAGEEYDLRTILAYAIWQFEHHLGNEKDKLYLAMLLIPMVRLPSTPCKIYFCMIIGIRLYVTYRKSQKPSTDIEEPDIPEEVEDVEIKEEPATVPDDVFNDNDTPEMADIELSPEKKPPRTPSPPPPPVKPPKRQKPAIKEKKIDFSRFDDT